MAEQQTPTIIVNVPGDLVDAPNAGMIRVEIPTGTSPQQMQSEALRLAREQVKGNALAIQGPGQGQSVGLQMPGGEGGADVQAAFESVIAAFPQAASFLAQLFPGPRAFGLAASAGIPAAAQTATNAMQGEPLMQGVMEEALLGTAAHGPQAIGSAAMGKARDIMRHNIFSTTPDELITRPMETNLPDLALELRAAPTMTGVSRMQREAGDARQLVNELTQNLQSTRGQIRQIGGPVSPTVRSGLQSMQNTIDEKALRATDIEMLADMLESVRKRHSIRGSGTSLNAVLPGQGATTTATRIAGLPAAVGQAAAPAVAMIKGSPARRMAFARNLHRPANIANSDTLGLGTSQLLRLLAALQQGMEPVASHERTDVGTGNAASRMPRRRQ